MLDLDRIEKAIDIHHIFPRKWCEKRGISPRIYDSIINKTAISYKANRKIGGNAPSNYLRQLQEDSAVQPTDANMDEILRSHSINPDYLRLDDFDGFFQNRKSALLTLIEHAMGKEAFQTNEPAAEDASDLEDED